MRSLRQPSSWLIAAGGLILFVWAPTSLYGLNLTRESIAPPWVALGAPLVVYAFLFCCLRALSTPQRIAGTVGLYGVHFLLGLLTERIYANGGPLPLGVPLDQALWASRTAPLLQLLSVPLAVWPFRDLIGSRRGLAAWAPHMVLEDFTPPPVRVTPPPGRFTPPPARVTASPVTSARTGTAPATQARWIFAQPPQAEREEPRAGAPAAGPPPPPASRVSAVPGSAPLTVTAAAPPTRVVTSLPPSRVPERVVPEPVAPVTDQTAVSPVETGIDETPAVEAAPPAPRAGAVEAPVVETVPPVVIDEEASVPPPAPSIAAEPVPIVGELTPQPALSAAELAEAQRLCAPLTRFGSLKVDVQMLMGVTLFSVHSGRLSADAVVRDAFRVLSRLGDCPGVGVVDQVTLRGSAGVMILTPLGSLANAGPVLNVAVPQRGSLALFEVLSRRAAAEYRQAHPAPPGWLAGQATASPTLDLAEIATPPGMGPIARTLGTEAVIAPLALRDPVGQCSIYLFLPPGVDGRLIGRVACQLRPLMEIDGQPGGIGAVQSVVLRVGDQRLVIRAATAPNPSLLVSAGPAGVQPGLVHRELDRAAERLAAV